MPRAVVLHVCCIQKLEIFENKDASAQLQTYLNEAWVFLKAPKVIISLGKTDFRTAQTHLKDE